MTVSEFNALVRYWNRHPPTHLLVGALLDSFSKASPEQSARTDGNFRVPAPPPDAPNWKTESYESMRMRWMSTPGTG